MNSIDGEGAAAVLLHDTGRPLVVDSAVYRVNLGWGLGSILQPGSGDGSYDALCGRDYGFGECPGQGAVPVNFGFRGRPDAPTTKLIDQLTAVRIEFNELAAQVAASECEDCDALLLEIAAGVAGIDRSIARAEAAATYEAACRGLVVLLRLEQPVTRVDCVFGPYLIAQGMRAKARIIQLALLAQDPAAVWVAPVLVEPPGRLAAASPYAPTGPPWARWELAA